MFFTKGHSRVAFTSVSKRVFVQNESYENVEPLQVLFHANQPHFLKERFCTKTSFETEEQGNSEIILLC